MPRLCSSALLLAGTLLAGEAAFRLVFPLPQVANFNRVDFSEFAAGQHAGPPPLMNASYRWASEPDGASFLHTLNLYGFRDPQTWCLRPDPERPRVLFAGDSLVEGVMATDEETIPRTFAAAVGPERVEALNMGVGGANLSHYFRLLATAVPLFRPRTVALVLYANDLPPPPFQPDWLEPRRPRRFQRWLPRAAHVAVRAWRGRPVPRRWHTAPFHFFRPVPDPSNPLTGRRPSIQADLIEPALLEAMRRGTFNPYLAEHPGVATKALVRPVDLRPHLVAVQGFLSHYGAQLVVAYIPHSLQVSDHYLPFARRYAVEKPTGSLTSDRHQQHAASVAATCRGLGVPFLDTTPLLRAQEQAGHRLYWDFDNHMRASGYALVGRALAALWRERAEGPVIESF
jgi:hypothetical protein